MLKNKVLHQACLFCAKKSKYYDVYKLLWKKNSNIDNQEKTVVQGTGKPMNLLILVISQDYPHILSNLFYNHRRRIYKNECYNSLEMW